MPTISVDQGQVALHYHDSGTGDPPVVLVHGFPFNSNQWRPQLETLASRHRVIAPDLRGFGASAPSPVPYTLIRLADDIAELLAALGVPPAVICGLSMGGYVAFEMFRRHRERVTALVLADTRPQPDSDPARLDRAQQARTALSDGVAPLVEGMLPRLVAPATRQRSPAVLQAVQEMMAAAPPRAIADALLAMAARDDSVAILSHIDVPTLVLVGSEDAITPASETREWAVRIPGAQLAVIAGAGHLSNLERPETFDSILSSFLDSLSGAAAR
jgi:pimeloyl-ACP methyl ester carboxylesterase